LFRSELVTALELAGLLRVDLLELGLLELHHQAAVRRLVVPRVGRGVQPAARPLLDLGQLVDHALAGEVGAALLRGLRPQQERRGGVHAEQGDLALPGLDQLLVLLHGRDLVGVLQRLEDHADVQLVTGAGLVPLRDLLAVPGRLEHVLRLQAGPLERLQQAELAGVGRVVGPQVLRPALLDLLSERHVAALALVVQPDPALQRLGAHLLHGALDLAGAGADRRGGGQQDVGLLLEVGEELLGDPQPADVQQVDRVRDGLVLHGAHGRVRADGEAGDGRQLARHAVLLGRLVHREALPDEEEVLLAGLLHDLRGLHVGGVVLVALDLASVDAALLVAPLDHGRDRVAHLLGQARRGREAAVVAESDGDGVVGHALVGGALGVARAARGRERPERRAARGLVRAAGGGAVGARTFTGTGRGHERDRQGACREAPDLVDLHPVVLLSPFTGRAGRRVGGWRQAGGRLCGHRCAVTEEVRARWTEALERSSAWARRRAAPGAPRERAISRSWPDPRRGEWSPR